MMPQFGNRPVPRIVTQHGKFAIDRICWNSAREADTRRFDHSARCMAAPEETPIAERIAIRVREDTCCAGADAGSETWITELSQPTFQTARRTRSVRPNRSLDHENIDYDFVGGAGTSCECVRRRTGRTG